jgi:hypothetical protein
VHPDEYGWPMSNSRPPTAYIFESRHHAKGTRGQITTSSQAHPNAINAHPTSRAGGSLSYTAPPHCNHRQCRTASINSPKYFPLTARHRFLWGQRARACLWSGAKQAPASHPLLTHCSPPGHLLCTSCSPPAHLRLASASECASTGPGGNCCASKMACQTKTVSQRRRIACQTKTVSQRRRMACQTKTVSQRRLILNGHGASRHIQRDQTPSLSEGYLS